MRLVKIVRKTILVALFVTGVQFLPLGIISAHAADPVNNSPAAVPPAENLDSPSFQFDLSAITHQGIEGSVRQSWIRGGINYFFERAIGFMAAIIGTLVVLMLSIGGFLMLSSAGNEQQFEQGKNFIKYSLIGLVVALSAYVLVTLVQLLIRSIYG